MTTPVGSIKLDLKIDGSGIPAEMVAAVRAGLQPVLAELQRDINALQRDYDKLGRDAVRSAEKQTAAAKATSRAVDDVGDEYREVARRAAVSAAEQVAANRRVAASLDDVGDHYTRLAATALMSARGQSSALDQVTRSIDQQTAAWGRLAAARTAAAATPTPGGPGGGGGGGGYGGGDRWRWHGGTGSGPGGFLTSPLGYNTMALGLGSWPAAATAVTNLTGAIQQLTQAGALVPGMVGGLVSSVGTLKLGLAGVKDGFEAAWKAAESGKPKDIQKAVEAMKNLAPAAQDSIKAVVGLRGEWQHLQRDIVQQNMFDGLDKTITDLSTRSMPTLEKGLGGISSAWNKTFKQLGASLGSDDSLSLMDQLFGNTAEAQTRANAAIEPWRHALMKLTAESSDFLPRLSDGLAALGTRFGDWIDKSVANGNLDKWINEGIEGATNFGNAFLNVGKIINDLTTAAGGDGGFLKWLNDATGRLHEFLSSTEGQEKLTTFFREGREQLKQWGPILKDVWTVFKEVYEGAKQWSAVLLPVLKQVTGLLSGMSGPLSAVVTGFLAFQSIRGLGRLALSLAGLNGGLATTAGNLSAAAGSAGTLSTRLGRIAGMAAGIAGLGLAIEGLANPEVKPNQVTPIDELGRRPGGSSASLIGGSALTGAAVAGLPGLAVGLGGGILADGIQGRRLYDQQMQQFNNALNAAPDDPAKSALLNQFYGKNIKDPRSLDIKPGTMNYDWVLSDIQSNPGDYGPGVNAGNAKQQLDFVIQNAKLAGDALDQLGDKISTLPSGDIKINNPTPEIIGEVEKLGLKVQQLPDGTVVINANTDVAMNKVAALNTAVKNVIGSIGAIPATIPRPQYAPNTGFGGAGGAGAIPRPPGRADGGVLPGYSPGVDNMLVPMSGGEGVLIPEAVRGLGGAAAIYAINSMFRPGLSRRGYAGGGVIGFDSGGVIPSGMSPMAADVAAGVTQAVGPLIGLLGEIRDVLKAAFPAPLQAPQPGAGMPGGWLPGALPALPPAATADTSLVGATTTGVSPATIDGITAGLASGGAWVPIKGSKNDPLTDGEKAINKQLTDTLKPLTSAINESIKKGGIGKLAELGLGPDNPLAGQLAAARNAALSQNAGLLAAAGPVGSQSYNDVLNKNVLGPLASALNRTVKGNAYTGKLAEYGIQASDPLIANLLGLRGQLATAPPEFVDNPAAAAGGLAGGGDMCGCIGQQVGDNMTGAMGLGVGQTLLGGITSGIQGALPVGDLVKAVGGEGTRPLPDKTADTATLLNQRNLLALPAAMGYQVGDYSRKGGQGPGVITANDGPGFNASGQVYSDTAALVDRSFTSLDASLKAGFDQLMDVMAQVRDQLIKIASDLAVSASNTAIGLAGGDPSGATPKALGGPITGGIAGRDSVPIMAMPGEHMLTVADVGAMGGQQGVYAFRRALHNGGVRGFAAGGAVDANSVVGAAFYGVSQIPIIGAIINMLNALLLKVIGVQIQARDTMVKMSDEFRDFRGDFTAFNASGRLLNDTSGLVDRSGTSAEQAADERVKILKIVIKELIEYIIQNVLVPIGKAVGKAAVAAGATAAGSAITAGSGGNGGPAGAIVSSLINAAGSAGVDIGAQVLGDLGVGLTDVLTEGIASMLQSSAPGLVQGIFGQGLSGLFPTGTINMPAMGGIAAFLAALLGTAAVFDEGGLATDRGLMPKAVIEPERVLSPRQTANHERLTDLLDSGVLDRLGGGDRTIHAPITVFGSEATARDLGDYLLEKLV